MIQAEAGLMSITGEADGRRCGLGVAIADIVSGMFAAQGIALALLARARTGRGQHVDIGMLDATAALLTYQAASYFATGRCAERLGQPAPDDRAVRDLRRADGDFVLAVGNDDLWRRFCKVIETAELADDPRFVTNRDRVEHYDELKPFAGRATAERDRRPSGLPRSARRACRAAQCATSPKCSRIRRSPRATMIEAVEHATLGAVRVLGMPIKLSDTPAPSAPLRRPSVSTRIRFCAPISG